MISGCALFEGPPIDRPDRPDPKAQIVDTDEPPVFVPDGGAEANTPVFLTTLTGVAEEAETIDGRMLVDTLTGVGFNRDNMQVSFDHSKTGLVADSLYVSVRFESECLIGQVDTASRDVYVTVTEAIGPDESLCLIGVTRSIDW